METLEQLNMPAPRGHMKRYTASFILVTVFVIVIVMTYENTAIVFQAFYKNLIIAIIAATVTSICYYMEERKHLKTRYGNKSLKVIAASMKLPYVHTVLLLVSAGIFLAFEKDTGPKERKIVILNFLVSIGTHCTFLLLGFHAPSIADVSDISERKHLNVAHGLAWSYYVGYLKLVLPDLCDKVAQYSGPGRVFTASTKKLFILIPISCHVTDTISEQDQHISVDGNLPERLQNRGGIAGRSYKHTVHRVLDSDDKEHYVVVEFATPLRALLEMSNHRQAGFSADDRLEQAKLFYLTLRNILQGDIDIRNKVQLVPYDDTPQASAPHFLSETILQHVSPIADTTSSLQFSDIPQPLRSNDIPQPLRSNDNL